LELAAGIKEKANKKRIQAARKRISKAEKRIDSTEKDMSSLDDRHEWVIDHAISFDDFYEQIKEIAAKQPSLLDKKNTQCLIYTTSKESVE
jgi:hypothetical protein